MLVSYIKIAFRSLLKNRVYSFINIFGLTIGIVSVVLIVLYVNHQYSFDKFHQKKDQLYKVTLERIYPTYTTLYAIIPHSFAEVMVDDFPEVEASTRVLGVGNQTITIKVLKEGKEIEFEENGFIQADSNFFNIFSYKLIKGTANNVLNKPNDVVLTESLATKFFGTTEAIGKELAIGQLNLTVTGICENPPKNSHMQFSAVGAMSGVEFITNTINYTSFSVHTYLQLAQGVDPLSVESKFSGMVNNYAASQIEQSLGTSFEDYVAAGNGYRYFLRPITSIHLDPANIEAEFPGGGNKTFVFILISIAVLILVIACINFMNLATARAAERAREVGVRKTLGSYQSQLIIQFLAESVLLALISMVLAMALLQIVIPAFNEITAMEFAIRLNDFKLIASIIAFALLVGLIAGIYPAFVLSSFNPAYVLKGSMSTNNSGKWLRNSLVVFQFTISIILIGATITVYKQLRFVQNKDLGFDKEQMAIIDNAFNLGDNLETFKKEAKTVPGVIDVGVGSSVPGGFFFGFQFQLEGNEEVITTKALNGDEDFCQVLSIKLVEGRLFSDEFNDSLSIILNNSAVDAYGLVDPIGKKILVNQLNNQPKVPLTIVGVVDNFHFMSLKDEITPLVIVSNSSQLGFNFNIAIKLKATDMPSTLAQIENKWKLLSNNKAFLYDFLDVRLKDQYEAEQASGRLFGIFAVLAIFIACVGLFGLAAYTANQKTKEIGIRKVLGSSVWGIMLLLTRHFTVLVIIALVIAIPITYFAMNSWLENFAYRTSIGLSTFAIAGSTAMLIAWATVSYQSLLAAIVNPVDSLANE
jgi:putative ABC transport system permease protein